MIKEKTRIDGREGKRRERVYFYLKPSLKRIKNPVCESIK